MKILLEDGVIVDICIEECYCKHKHLLYKIALKYVSRKEMRYIDDMFQIASIGFIKAFNTYNVEKGFCFSTYMYKLASREIQNYLIKNNKVLSVNNCINLDDEEHRHIFASDMSDDMVVNAQVSIIIDIINTCLTPKQRDVMTKIYIKGYGKSDVARMNGCSRENIYQIEKYAIDVIRKKLVITA